MTDTNSEKYPLLVANLPAINEQYVLRSLEDKAHHMVLDDLFTRYQQRMLSKLIDEVKKGETEESLIIGFLTFEPEGKLDLGRISSARAPRDYIPGSMRELFITQFGKEEGLRFFTETFKPYFELKDEVINKDRTLNLTVAEIMLGTLENAFSQVELASFVIAPNTTRNYLLGSIKQCREQIEVANEAFEKNSGVLPNGKKLPPNFVEDTQERIHAYYDAIARLDQVNKDRKALGLPPATK